MTFDHPALTSAAERLTALRAAAGRIGAPDPVAALRYVDCAPAVIRASATTVEAGAAALSSARAEFREGVERAETTGFTGPWADTVDGQYDAAAAAALETAEAGHRIAAELDASAEAAATKVTELAESASAAVTAVLSGDRSPEVVSTVSAACTAIVRAVQTQVASLSELVTALEPLTTPASRPD